MRRERSEKATRKILRLRRPVLAAGMQATPMRATERETMRPHIVAHSRGSAGVAER